MDRRGVWVRKPMFEADWEDTSVWAAYSEAAMSVSDSNPPVTEGPGHRQVAEAIYLPSGLFHVPSKALTAFWCRSVAANPTRPDHRSDLRPDSFPRAEVGSEDALLMGRRVAIPPLAVVVSGSRGDQRGLHASSRSGRQGDV